jgi:alkylation response protein AidB-like acyl-CoA dehydrogenase
MWQSACENGVLTIDERIEVRMATTHAIRQASEVIDTVYDLIGTEAIFTTNPIQRRYQDMAVILQHIQSKLTNYETVGRFFLGLEPAGPL